MEHGEDSRIDAGAAVIQEESEERSFFIKQREMASGRVAVLGRSGGVKDHQRKRPEDQMSYPSISKNCRVC
jgi:hypothetical protein